MSPRVSINDQFAHAGLAAYFEHPVRDPAHAERVARLLLDERWPWLPWYLSYRGIDRPFDRASKRVNGTTGPAPLAAGLLDPTLNAALLCRSVGDKNFGEAELNLGRIGKGPFELLMVSRVAELPSGKTTAAWLTLVQDLVQALSPANAILGVWPARTPAVSDAMMMRVVLDARWGQHDLGVLPTSSDPTKSWDIGRQYARYPRWGTYLKDEHLAAIGGADRVRADVEPCAVERIGTVTYIQLTDAIETAMTPLAGERRRRLEALMAPILAPR